MNKQKKDFVIILVIFIVCVAGFIGVKLYNQNVSDDSADDTIDAVEVYGAEADDITAFTYTDSNNEEVSLYLKDETWYNAIDETMDMDETSINNLLSNFSGVSSTKQITDANASDYGFDTPTNEFTVTTAEQTVTLTYGMYNEMTQEYYLIINNDTSIIYVTDGSLLSVADSTIADLQYEESDTETEE